MPKTQWIPVEEKYNPGNASILGSCENLERRVENIDKTVFGMGGTFRNTTECREMVHDYMYLWWGSNNAMNTNRCNACTHPPCRSFCIQIALLCANNEDWKDLCNHIECPPSAGYSCIPGPYKQPESQECAMYNTPYDLRSTGTSAMRNSSWLVILCMTILIIGIRKGV